ncbi:DUF4340 domain-containing protein [Fulvivirgaceae bacterium BMA10]|uniref:DUF4340 domain-containing protein n=1 Tax=Splendidivirga corallicola TaxID=3051826 RepID=A0ABT8KRX6_9BACT|nr:DUF4340 domain-containing protein [Fulvivirgaceae bacterium BMA10]
MKKISLAKLLGVLVILLLIYFALDFFGKSDRSSSFREVLVEIDTAEVTKLKISKNTETVELNKQNGQWLLSLENGKQVLAKEGSVEGTFSSLMNIKPSRIATKDQKKWKDYQVDSTGVRVEVFEGDNNSLDLIIGRFGAKGRNQFHTFVRLFEEDEVYAADNFIGGTVSSDAGAYRDQSISNLTADSLQTISFIYPADSTFKLEKVGDQWSMSGRAVDSANMASYLADIRYLSSSSFSNDVETSQLTSPLYSFIVTSKGEDDLQIDAYHTNNGIVLQSSLNETGLFRDEALVEKIFKSGSYFESKEE